MRIIRLQAENIKKIKAIDITPTTDVVIVSGNNGTGKSSALDAIWYVLEGRNGLKKTPEPIRKGEKKASITLTLDDFIVTRNFTSNNKSYLKVTNKEGLFYNSPQELLDSFIGKLTFDPLEFAGMKEKEQSELLLRVAGIKIDEIEEQIFIKREERRLQGQKVKLLNGQREVINPEIVPKKLVSTSELNEELENSLKSNQERYSRTREMEGSLNIITGIEESITDLKKQIENGEKEIERHRQLIRNGEKFLKETKPIEIEPIKEKLSGAEEVNEIFRANERNKEADKKLTEEQKIYDDYTGKIDGLIKDKEDALKSAKMPITGLSINNTGVTYNDIPFGQLSSSEQLKVSLAIAIALNPKLRVIRITDGSLLDEDNMELIKKLAKEEDYQVWIERVGTGDLGFYFVDGEIESINGEKVETDYDVVEKEEVKDEN